MDDSGKPQYTYPALVTNYFWLTELLIKGDLQDDSRNNISSKWILAYWRWSLPAFF